MATVQTDTTLSSITLSYLSAAIKLQCFDGNGNELELSEESRFVVRRGDVVRLTATGFKPGSEIRAAIFSSPTALGTVRIDAAGDGVQRWKIPGTISAGTHTLVASGDLEEAEDAVFGLRVVVGRQSFAERVASSVAARVMLGLGMILGSFVPAASRRRRHVDGD